ncbi:MAG TPA: cysteine hydrolase family protein [Longimicrobium sp.]|nr:cysteine hydrolase family protein [Longimicrobium sp.]
MTDRMARIGWVVDAQNDFLIPAADGGRLYVHDLFDGGEDAGAIQIIPNLARAVEWMRANCDVMVYTGDWHAYGDAEIDPVSPDATKGTYPPHCMGMSDDPAERAGAEIHASVRPDAPIVLPRDATEETAREVARTAIGERRPVFIQKDRFDVFEGNPAAEALLRELRTLLGGRVEVFVAGVARDVCVKHAVEGLLAPVRGYPVTLVTDATWGLGLEEESASLARWSHDGAALITTRGLELRAA